MKNKVEKILYYLVTACAMNLIFFLRMLPEYIINKEVQPSLLTYILCGLIGLLFLLGILSSILLSIRATKFTEKSLGCEYRVVELENQTGLQYFTHFSLLFLTAFSIPYTCILLDFVFIILIHFFLGFIYIKENLYYINPILNIYGYRTYKCECKNVKTNKDKTIYVLARKYEIKKDLIIKIKSSKQDIIRINKTQIKQEKQN